MVIFFTNLLLSWFKDTACSDTSTVVTEMVFLLKLGKHRTDVTFLFDLYFYKLFLSGVDFSSITLQNRIKGNVESSRLNSRYGWHFPEMGKIITDNLAYVRTVQVSMP